MSMTNYPLQWGRAFSGTEIAIFFHAALFFALLQWGRAFSGTEIAGKCVRLKSTGTLQWGRAFSGTEIKCQDSSSGGSWWASMGPCLFRHGNKW